MKKILLLFLASLCFLTGCSKEIVFEKYNRDEGDFHEIVAAEKVDGGVLYYSGRKLLYEKDGNITEFADKVTSLWRENQDIYYSSDDVLYTYNFDTQVKTKMVKSPKKILGKYDGRIISYSGRNIYAIEGTKKTKIFKDGYYLNRAILYGNKVYGIPASNIYSYDLDTLKVKKVTTQKHDMADFFMANDELYVSMRQYKKNSDQSKYTYYKVTDAGLKKEFQLNGCSSAGVGEIVKDGMFVATAVDDYDRKGNRLFYISDGKKQTIDKDYYYDILGIYENKLLYYKNESYFGSEQENLTAFYLYDGKNSTKAFDLDVGFFEGLYGYEYEGGILIEVSYESAVKLYNYDGESVKEVDMGGYVYSISSLAVIDGKLYLNYWDGEESMERLGAVIEFE